MRVRKIYITATLMCLPVIFIMCRKPGTFSENDYDSRLSGGAASAFDETAGAFGHEVPTLNENDSYVHGLGDGAVEQSFVTAPAPVNSGLGPIFSNVSCVSCHHNDGKGNPTAGLVNSSLLIRMSLIGTDEHGDPVPVPGYGAQLQDVAVFGRQAEAKVDIQYTYENITLPGGQIVELRKPTYTLLNPYLPLPSVYMTSPRMAPPFFGLGLLQNIPEQTILSFADENDADGDGISGKPNYVWDPVLHKTTVGNYQQDFSF